MIARKHLSRQEIKVNLLLVYLGQHVHAVYAVELHCTVSMVG